MSETVMSARELELARERCQVPGCGRRKYHKHRRDQPSPVEQTLGQVQSARARGKSVLLVELGDKKFIPKWELVEQQGSDDERDRAKPVALMFVSEAILRELEPLVRHDPRVKLFAKFMKGRYQGPPRPPAGPGGAALPRRAVA